MAKRFSVREMALLMAPVALIGALGLWASRRPKPPIDDGKLSLKFRVDKPTTLEAFQGYDGAFDVEASNQTGTNYLLNQAAPYLELKTARGIEVSRLSGGTSGFWMDVWGGNNNNSRFTFKIRPIPPGTLHFGFDGFVQPPSKPAPMPIPARVRVSGKWKVDRAKIKAPNLASWPRKPWLEVREIKITEVYLSPNTKINGPNSVTGEIVFSLKSAAMDERTSFQANFSEHHFVPSNQSRYGMSYNSEAITKTPRTRVQSWTVRDDLPTTKMNVSGRASADNRWPLGFEIEPFDFKSVKVGQKLKFKQFPVALPKP